ncbi:MAG: tetratricopeptide repeat protein, partial [bacterium]|nr:tetratricopeptide repeat protein [bacterium]
MNRSRIISLLVVAAGAAILISGCAYFNTYYNAKRKFSEAENDNRSRPTPAQTQTPVQPQTTPSPPAGAGVQRDVRSPEKYRKVIETCSKLLEFYPKSRWVDDALYLMGVSYYRLGELDRADRKFTELVTIFPKSVHVPEAILFHARSLGEQGKRSEA